MQLQMRDGTYDAKSVPALKIIQQQLQQIEQEMTEAVEQVRQLRHNMSIQGGFMALSLSCSRSNLKQWGKTVEQVGRLVKPAAL
jgi:hypothetical protein